MTTHASKPTPSTDEQTQRRSEEDANALMVAGAGIGALGAVTAMIGGAVCPVCVVAAPALIGVGAFRKWKASRAKR